MIGSTIRQWSQVAAVATTVLLCHSSLWAAAPADESEIRTWSDSTGRFTVEAKLLQSSATHVKLRTSAGREMVVRIDQLSDPDRKYLAGLQAESDISSQADSESMGSDPDEPTGPVATASPPGPELMALDGSIQTAADGATLPDEGDVKLLLEDEPASGLAADPALDRQPLPYGGFQVAPTDAYDHVSRPFLVDKATMTVALSIGRHKVNEPEKARGRIFVGPLPKGPSEMIWDVSEGAELVDFEPNSGRAIMVSNFDHFKRGGDLVLLDGLADGKPKQLFRRRLPGMDKPGFKPQVKWARLLSGEHVAALVDAKLYVWNLRTAQLLYGVDKMDGTHFPALSPNRRYMAIPKRAGATIIDVVDGRFLGSVSMGGLLTPGVVFHPDGRRIALSESNQFLVWDYIQGKATCEATLPGHIGGKLVGWVTPHALLTGSGRLIRTDLEMTTWSYSLPPGMDVVSAAEGVLFAQKISSCFVNSMPIPHSAAVGAGKQLQRGSEAMMLIRPGSKVALDAELPDGIDRETVISALSEAVEKTGWDVVRRAETTVVALIGQGEEQQLSYRTRTPGQPRDSAPVETASIRPFTAEIQIRRGGEVLWTRKTRNYVPSMLFLKNGQTLQQAVTDFERPNPEFFARLAIPPRIPKPEIADGLGRSLLDNSGWRDVSAADIKRAQSRRRSGQ